MNGTEEEGPAEWEKTEDEGGAESCPRAYFLIFFCCFLF
jgi:hypothetical protein